MTTPSLYKVHCHTFAIARKIMECGNTTTATDHPFHGFRCLPQYRTESGKKLRQMVFLALKGK